MTGSETTSRIAAIAYRVISPNEGSGYRLYEDEDVYAAGGVHALERVLETESYWFVRLGQVTGEQNRHGITFPDSEFAQLARASRKRMEDWTAQPRFRKISN